MNKKIFIIVFACLSIIAIIIFRKNAKKEKPIINQPLDDMEKNIVEDVEETNDVIFDSITGKYVDRITGKIVEGYVEEKE